MTADVFVSNDPSSPFRAAHADFIRGILSWRLWMGLGLQDIRIRYKRTVLGPWWITASQVTTFVCMGMLFSAVLRSNVHQYLPYLACGMVTWTFMGGMANDSPQIFVSAHHVITSLRMPLVVHVLRVAVRNFVVFLHNACAALAAHFILGGNLSPAILLLLATLPLLFVIVSAGGLLLAIVGARFRDVIPMIGIAVQLGFFMTPIIWRPEDIPDGTKWWVDINPAHHLIEVVRGPMVGQVPPATSVVVAAATALVLTVFAWLAFCRLRHRIVFWL